MEKVLDWSIAESYRLNNPAGKAIVNALPKVRNEVVHLKAVHYADCPATVRRIRESKLKPVYRLVLEFIILTAARSGSARAARWKEINWESATWTTPASHMKARSEHRVPLSDAAIEVLKRAWEISGRAGPDGLIFPSVRGGKMAEDTLTEFLREAEIPGTVHSFRSTFRDWCMETTVTPWAVGEATLAHKIGSSTASAYARSDLLEQRRGLMQEWVTIWE